MFFYQSQPKMMQSTPILSVSLRRIGDCCGKIAKHVVLESQIGLCFRKEHNQIHNLAYSSKPYP